MVRTLGLFMRTRMVPLTVVCLCAVTFAPLSRAELTGSPITPGNSGSPNDFTGQTTGTLLASLSEPFSYTTTSGTNSGSIISAVYEEAGGTLDFIYQVVNSPNSVTALARETDVDFSLGTTWVMGFRTDGATLPGGDFVTVLLPPLRWI